MNRGLSIFVAGCLVHVLAVEARAEPAAPVALAARITGADEATGTVGVEITARPTVKTASVTVTCELPKGAAIVPGTGEWAEAPRGGRVLTLRVTPPRGGGKLIIKARLHGVNIRAERVVGLALPGLGKGKAPARVEKPRIITTTKGERLRLHKKQ